VDKEAPKIYCKNQNNLLWGIEERWEFQIRKGEVNSHWIRIITVINTDVSCHGSTNVTEM
jgi:hypothetical protein